MADLVEDFNTKMETLPEHLPGEDINPNPVFDPGVELNFVPKPPEVNTGDFDFTTKINVLDTGSGYGEPLTYEPLTDIEAAIEEAFHETTLFVRERGYDIDVMNKLVADGHAVGFCVGSIRTQLDMFSAHKNTDALLDIIHYASMALYALKDGDAE